MLASNPVSINGVFRTILYPEIWMPLRCWQHFKWFLYELLSSGFCDICICFFMWITHGFGIILMICIWIVKWFCYIFIIVIWIILIGFATFLWFLYELPNDFATFLWFLYELSNRVCYIFIIFVWITHGFGIIFNDLYMN